MNQQKEKFQLTNWELVSVNPTDKTWKWTDYFYFWAVEEDFELFYFIIFKCWEL